MNEQFIEYLWKYKVLKKNIVSTDGQPVELINPGTRNEDSGPDFFNAKVRVNETTWAGNVEIHVKSSDWFRHKHQFDEAYDNVILHVVFLHDAKVKRKNGEVIPTIEVKGNFNEGIFRKYEDFMMTKSWVPCEGSIQATEVLKNNSWLNRLLAERLEGKSRQIEDFLTVNKMNWEEAFYIFLARNFGFRVNALPFEMLAKSTPLKILARHKDDLFQLEAILFGQAGLLEGEFSDDYPRKLQKEYRFLREKYGLFPVEGHLWRFFRLRPGNFPTIRIAQFARLIHQSSGLFGKLLKNSDISKVRKLFDVTCDGYWDDHYKFDKKSPKRKKIIGGSALQLILINTIVPFLFVYGKILKQNSYQETAIDLLSKIPGEKNTIISRWGKLGMDVSNAANTQALLELKNNYCRYRKCLNCGIGAQILKNA